MTDNKTYKPDWHPENAGNEYAVRIVKPSASTEKKKNRKLKAKKFDIDELYEGVLKNDRVALAKAITLIESNSEKHHADSQRLLTKLMPHSGKSFRIGVTGVPGAGKSTLIESLGIYLIERGMKIAVLTIDPSSRISGGSILGDKTRMERLSRQDNCFIRPSPSGGALGGVARKTRETLTVCEAAGYDVILIETVGVGQSETTVRSMVDFFLLVLIAGAGDELQGIKKGIMELTDCIVVNKCDGDNVSRANLAKKEYQNALHYLQPATAGGIPKVITASAIKDEGTQELWEIIEQFKLKTIETGIFLERRKRQDLQWTNRLLRDGLEELFFRNRFIKNKFETLKSEIINGKLPPTTAAEILLNEFVNHTFKE